MKRRAAGQKRRLLHAMAIVGLLAAACGVATAVPLLGRDSVYADFSIRMLGGGATAETAGDETGSKLWNLMDVISDGAPAVKMLPDGFEDELFSSDGWREVRTAGNGTVVGLVKDGDAAEAVAQARQSMEDNGWTVAEGSAPERVTLVKETGAHRWAFVSGTNVAQSASVVIALI